MEINSLIPTVIVLIVLVLLACLFAWAIRYLNPPEPVKKTAIVVAVVLAVLVLIGFLLRLMNTGGGGPY